MSNMKDIEVFDYDIETGERTLRKQQDTAVPVLVLIGCVAIDIVRRKERLQFHQRIEENDQRAAATCRRAAIRSEPL